MAVFRSDLLKPHAVVAEKISETSGIGIESEPQKSQVTARETEIVLGLRAAGALIQQSGDNQRARVVVGGIALARVGQRENCVLQHSRVVSHGVEMTCIRRRQMVHWIE